MIDVQIKNRVAHVKIQRPEALNALNSDVLMELRQKLISLENVQVVVLRGEGDKAFVAGADIKSMQKMSSMEARTFAELGQGVIQLIEEAPWVSIAAVHGFALGGGLELALACDLIYASHDSKFGAPETNLGIIPGFGGTVNLIQRIGFQAAMDWILTGRIVNAEEALQRQLLAQVFQAEEFFPQVDKIAENLANKGIYSILAAKRLIRLRGDAGRAQAMLLERESFATLFASGEPEEGMKAFLEKRAPKFSAS